MRTIPAVRPIHRACCLVVMLLVAAPTAARASAYRFDYIRECPPYANTQERVRVADLKAYVLPISNRRLLVDADIANLTTDEIWIAKNEILARYGYAFTNGYLASYFGYTDWYKKGGFSYDLLSSIENRNVAFLKKAEDAQRERWQPIGKKSDKFDIDGDGSKDAVALAVGKNKNEATLTVGKAKLSLSDKGLEAYGYQEDVYIADLVAGDGKLEVAVTYGYYWTQRTTFYRYDGAKLASLGTIETHSTTLAEAKLDGKSGILMKDTCGFGKYGVSYRAWKLANGRIQAVPSSMGFVNIPLEMGKGGKLTTGKSATANAGKAFDVSAGEELLLRRYQDVGGVRWWEIMNASGECGWAKAEAARKVVRLGEGYEE